MACTNIEAKLALITTIRHLLSKQQASTLKLALASLLMHLFRKISELRASDPSAWSAGAACPL